MKLLSMMAAAIRHRSQDEAGEGEGLGLKLQMPKWLEPAWLGGLDVGVI